MTSVFSNGARHNFNFFLEYNFKMKAVNIKSNRKVPKNRPFPIAVHNLHQEVEPTKKKFKKHKKRNPFDQFYKEKVRNFPMRSYDRLLDGYILLGSC